MTSPARDFNSAMQCRIHLAIKYPALSLETRRTRFENVSWNEPHEASPTAETVYALALRGVRDLGDDILYSQSLYAESSNASTNPADKYACPSAASPSDPRFSHNRTVVALISPPGACVFAGSRIACCESHSNV